MITHRQIEAFKAIMEVGTAMHAASLLNISASAISHQLSELEDRLGYPLFERRKGRLIPRREASELFAEVERSFSGLRRIEEAAFRIGRSQAGRLRVVALPALSMSPLPAVASRFMAGNPDAHLSIQVRPRHEVVQGIVNQRYDLALVTLPVKRPEVAVALTGHLPFHCIMHPGHPLAGRAEITPKDFDGVEFVCVAGEGPLNLRRGIDRMFRDAGVELEVHLECSTMAFGCSMAVGGFGVVFAPPICIDEMMRPHLKVMPFAPAVGADIAILHPVGRPPDDLACHFIDAFAESLSEDGGARVDDESEIITRLRNEGLPAAGN